MTTSDAQGDSGFEDEDGSVEDEDKQVREETERSNNCLPHIHPTLPLSDWLCLRHEKERRAIQSTELLLLSGFWIITEMQIPGRPQCGVDMVLVQCLSLETADYDQESS